MANSTIGERFDQTSPQTALSDRGNSSLSRNGHETWAMVPPLEIPRSNNDVASIHSGIQLPGTGERQETEAHPIATSVSEAWTEGESRNETGKTTALGRGLSISRTVRYETSTDAEPESPGSVHSVPDAGLDSSQGPVDALDPPQEDEDEGMNQDLQNQDELSIPKNPKPLTDDASIEELWKALLQEQIRLLGPENPLVYESRHQLALSWRAHHQDMNLTRALKDTLENAEITLGRTHPLVQAFNANFHLLCTAIAKEISHEKPAPVSSKLKSPAKLAGESPVISRSSPQDDILRAPAPLSPKEKSIPSETNLKAEPGNMQSSRIEHNGNEPECQSQSTEQAKAGASDTDTKEVFDSTQNGSVCEAAGPSDLRPSKQVAMTSQNKVLDILHRESQTYANTAFTVPLCEPNGMRDSVSEKRNSVLGTIEESPRENEEGPPLSSASNPDNDTETLPETFETPSFRTRQNNFQGHTNDRSLHPQRHARFDAPMNPDLPDSKPQPPAITTHDGIAYSNFHLGGKTINTPSTPSSFPVTQKIEDWLSSLSPPHESYNTYITALRLAIVGFARMVFNVLFWLLRNASSETTVSNGKVRVRWKCVSHTFLCYNCGCRRKFCRLAWRMSYPHFREALGQIKRRYSKECIGSVVLPSSLLGSRSGASESINS